MTRSRRLAVHLTRIAEEDLGDIYDHIAVESPGRAAEQIDRLLKLIEELPDFPLAHPVAYESRPHRPLRHIAGRSFRVVYEIKGRLITVVAVRHTRRNPTELA